MSEIVRLTLVSPGRTIGSMSFLSPWWLLGLPLVALVAMLTIRRQDCRLMVVSSVKLWLGAGGVSENSSYRNRRITASWVCLLLGATAGVIALAGPVWQVSGPVRHVRLELSPSAELATSAGLKALRSTALTFLDRLNSGDFVQVVLPVSAGGAGDWLTQPEARNELQKIQPLPIRAADMIFPPGHAIAQHTYRIGPAGVGQAELPGLSQIDIPTDIPAISFDAIAGKIQPGGKVQIFAALRNNGSKTWQGDVVIQSVDMPGDGPVNVPTRIGPGQVVHVIREMTPAGGFRISAGEARAWLARQNSHRVKVTIQGRDEPALRRYIQADPLLELWAGVGDADLIIANGAEPPSGVPALMINPPKSPPGLQADGVMENILLSRADVSASDDILKNVALAGLAIRQARPWSADRYSMSRAVSLISVEGRILMSRTAPGSSALSTPRRVYTAFDISAENTNIQTDQNFVVLLANVFRWLTKSDSAEARITYSYQTPIQTAGESSWEIVDAGRPGWVKNVSGEGLKKWPGLYRDEAAGLHAVNLIGLTSAKPARPPEQTIAALILPSPVQTDAAWPIWPGLIVLTIIFWVTGWLLRVR